MRRKGRRVLLCTCTHCPKRSKSTETIYAYDHWHKASYKECQRIQWQKGFLCVCFFVVFFWGGGGLDFYTNIPGIFLS